MRLVVWDAPAATERAWLNVHSSSECLGLALAPLLPTRRDATDAAGIAAFVHHPEYAQLARRDRAEIARARTRGASAHVCEHVCGRQVRSELAWLVAAELPRVDRLSLEKEATRIARAWQADYMELVAREVMVYDVLID